MPSRRKRKRERRTAEATATVANSPGGRGGGALRPLADFVLWRRAIRHDWPLTAGQRVAMASEAVEAALSPDVRRSLSAVRTLVEMEGANRRAKRIG